MNSYRKMLTRTGARKIFSVLLMSACLLFLTSLNYFIYPDQKASTAQTVEKSNFSSGPTEEKPASSGSSILEEFLHEHHSIVHLGPDQESTVHFVTDDNATLAFDGELLSPPPECRYYFR